MIDLTPEQRAAAFDDAGNLVVEAAPGAGKTRVLVARIAHLIHDRGTAPDRILALTFSRRAVHELRERIAQAMPHEAARIEVRTFHGFASRLLEIDTPGFVSGRLLEKPASEVLLLEAFARVEPHGFAPHVFRSPAFARDAERYVADLARADDNARAALEREGSDGARDLLRVADTLRDLRKMLGFTDYDDLVARAARLAADPSSRLRAALRDRYAHILVDEFQDTDPQQLALLEAIPAVIFAVGDAAQAIYGFRGAARDAIERAAVSLRMRRVPLRVSHRCAPEICALVNATPGLSPESRVETQSVAIGTVRAEKAATPLDEATLVADRVKNALDSGTPPGEIGVLLRALEPLGPLVRTELERRGIRASLVGGDAIVHEPIVRVLLDALRALADERDPDRWRDLFSSFAFGLPRLRMARAFATAPPLLLEQALEVLHTVGDGRVAHARIGEALHSAREAWPHGDLAAIARGLVRGLDLLGAAVALDDVAAARANARLKRALYAIDDLVRLHMSLQRPLRCAELLELFERHAAGLSDDSEQEDTAVVRILTIHGAKGLEFDAVVVADAADGRLPVELARDGVLADGDLALAREHGCDLGATPRERLAEERSLWYVALTRARHSLTVTSARASLDGSPQNPTRFLPVDRREALASTPPFYADLTYAGADRLPTAHAPEPVPLPAEIGVTRIDDWFTCERKFFYASILRLPSETAFERSFGTALHLCIERFHREHARVDESFERERAVALLRRIREEVWTELGDAFESTLEHSASAASADRMLAAYAAQLAETGAQRPFTVDAVEQRIKMQFGPFTLRGKIDRIDRFDDGGARIVDVKSGRMKSAFGKQSERLVAAVAEGALYGESAPDIASVQLPLYRRAVPEAESVALLYLRGKDGEGPVLDDTQVGDGALFAAIDEAIERGFVQRITGALDRFGVTQSGRTCERCAFATICDGALTAMNS